MNDVKPWLPSRLRIRSTFSAHRMRPPSLQKLSRARSVDWSSCWLPFSLGRIFERIARSNAATWSSTAPRRLLAPQLNEPRDLVRNAVAKGAAFFDQYGVESNQRGPLVHIESPPVLQRRFLRGIEDVGAVDVGRDHEWGT